jgi:hypothetical protein
MVSKATLETRRRRMHAFLAGVRDRRCSVTGVGGRAVQRMVDLSIPAVIRLTLPEEITIEQTLGVFHGPLVEYSGGMR